MNGACAADDGVKCAPRLVARRAEIVLAHVHGLEAGVLRFDVSPDVILDVATHDQDDLLESGGTAVLDGEVEDRLARGTDSGELFHSTEPAPEPCGHDH